jgi:hypothetical protein
MSRRNRTCITPYVFQDPGRLVEGFVKTGQTFYPGMCVQQDPSVTLKGGRFTHEVFNRSADGDFPKGPHIIVIENYLMGGQLTTAYAAGERFFGFVPHEGEELNLLLLDVAGTADDHAPGELLIVKNNSGKFIADTGSPKVKAAVVLEQITDPVADTLCWCRWGAA